MANVNLITLRCSNCSASLQLSDKLDRFICNYCGTEQLLVSGADGYFFKRLEDRLDSLEKTTEKGNTELALKRLREDLRVKHSQIEAIREDRETCISRLASDRESVFFQLIGTAFAQAVIFKVDMSVSIYLFWQTCLVIAALYLIRSLSQLQKSREQHEKSFHNEHATLKDEIAAIELKIKNRLKIVEP